MSSRLSLELLNPLKNPATLASLYNASPFDHLPKTTTAAARSRCHPLTTSTSTATTSSTVLGSILSVLQPIVRTRPPACDSSSDTTTVKLQVNKVVRRLFTAPNAHRGDSTWRQPSISPKRTATNHRTRTPPRRRPLYLDDTDSDVSDYESGNSIYDLTRDDSDCDTMEFELPLTLHAYSLDGQDVWR